MIECVVNVSEGRSRSTLTAMADACRANLLDLHVDALHNRSVFTLAGVGLAESVKELCSVAIAQCDLGSHAGVHPRLGIVDVVPFVALEGSTIEEARHMRDEVALWLGERCAVPTFLYGADLPSLPDIRRHAFDALMPTYGPMRPHSSAGVSAVGVREVLVAYNLILGCTRDEAIVIARGIRGRSVRALTFMLGDAVQLSMNLIEPYLVGPCQVTSEVSSRVPVRSCELVGLVPEKLPDLSDPVLARKCGLDVTRTIEYRLCHGYDPTPTLARL
ncbi:MAG: hypothetical protein ACYDHP_09450 [Ferrimicrobium sp.]